MKMFKDKELRGYIGAATVFLLVMGLLLFLAFFEIPDTNNDIFKVIVGMLVGSLSVVIYTFIGKNPKKFEALKAKNEVRDDKSSAMVIAKDKLEALLRDLQNQIIENFSLAGGKFEFKNNGKIT